MTERAGMTLKACPGEHWIPAEVYPVPRYGAGMTSIGKSEEPRKGCAHRNYGRVLISF